VTSLESVALDQERWRLTSARLKNSNHERFSWMVKLSLAGVVLEALALQTHTVFPLVAQAAGYAGAVALALALAVRVRGLREERTEAWVLASAASLSLKSELYQYRTSSGLYAQYPGTNPEAMLLRRRDDILEKVRSLQKYVVDPDSKTVFVLRPLDVEGYISERVETEISAFRRFTRNMKAVQNAWRKRECLMVLAAILMAAVLTFTHSQAFAAWVIVIIAISLGSGVTAKADRYASLIVGYEAMADRLTNIVARWQANRGPFDELVQQVETALLTEAQAWVLGVDEFPKNAASQREDLSAELDLHSASQAGA